MSWFKVGLRAEVPSQGPRNPPHGETHVPVAGFLRSPRHYPSCDLNMEPYLEEQGVTIADVAWWANLGWWGKKNIKASEHAYVSAWLKEFERQGIRSPEDILRNLDKVALCYADYASKEEMLKAVLKCERLGYAADDYPLPWQLQKRCNEFTQRCFNSGQHEWFKESARRFNTMNAFYRAQMREGKI